MVARSDNRLIVSVSMVAQHPLCRIPALVPGSPSRPIETTPGVVAWLRPERAWARDGLLRVHDWCSINHDAPLDHILYRRLTRVATRFERFIARLAIEDALLLDWPEPERLVFAAGDDPAVARRFHSTRHPSSEHLMLKRTPTSTSLVLTLAATD